MQFLHLQSMQNIYKIQKIKFQNNYLHNKLFYNRTESHQVTVEMNQHARLSKIFFSTLLRYHYHSYQCVYGSHDCVQKLFIIFMQILRQQQTTN